MADEGLLIPIQFSLEEARAALAQLEAQARAAGVRTGEGLGKGVEGGLKGLKASMGQARGSAMFFTQALGEFGPQGRTAQIALSGVAGAILGGGGVLAALSLAQAGARLLADAWNENELAAKKAAAEAKKAADEIAEKIKEARERVQQEMFKLAETSPAEVFAQTALKKAKDELADAEAEFFGSAGRLKAAKKAFDFDAIAAWSQRLEAARAALPGLRTVAAESQKAYDILLGQGELGTLDKTTKEGKDAQKKAQDERKALVAEFRAELDAADVEYASKRAALLAAAELTGLDERAKAELEYLRTMAGLRDGDTASEEAALQIRNAKITALDKAQYDERLALVLEFRAEILAGEAEEKAKQKAIQDQYSAFMKDSYRELASSALGAFKPILMQSAAYNRAMKEAGLATSASADLSAAAFAAMAQSFLANLAIQAGSKAIFEIAEGYASAAIPGGQPAAALHFAAATNYGIVAGLAAAGAITIGATRGTTRAERESIAGQTAGSGGGASLGGAREYGGGSGSGGGTITVRETIYVGVVANDFESPAETARRAARVMELAGRLDLIRRAEA